jgi:dynein light intermediate chain, axonemal
MSIPSQGPATSLVKYDTATLVSTSTKKKKGTKLASKKKRSTEEECLNTFLPPREFTQDGQLWIQEVSSTPATRIDVINLQDALDTRLQQRGARETGICPIREELFAQCFDEIIRQIALQCLERGLLLVRVRDELRTTKQAYQTLYESAIAYGMRKALQAEQEKIEMSEKIKALETENKELESQVETLERQIEETEAKDIEDREKAEKLHQESVEQLKKSIQAVKDELQAQLQAPKK